jgi:hypothetical protein
MTVRNELVTHLTQTVGRTWGCPLYGLRSISFQALIPPA